MRLRSLKNVPRLGQRGDTIIEVLIAVGIASLVLASAFAITNRNSNAAQDVQEHSTAQKLVETQTEYLRAASAAGEPTIPSGEFCFDGPNSTPSASEEACTIGTGGGAEYHQKITLVSPSTDTYEVSATWDTIGGQTAKVSNYYKVVETSP